MPCTRGLPSFRCAWGALFINELPAGQPWPWLPLLRWTEQSLSADFTLFDSDHQVVAVVKEARFRRIRLLKGAADRLQLLKEQWEPMPLNDAAKEHPLLSFARVQEVLAEVAARLALSGPYRRYTQEVDPLLDVLCGQWCAEALQQLADERGVIDRQRIEAWGLLQPDLQPFFEYLLNQGLDDQSLVAHAEGYAIQPPAQDQVSARDIWNSMVADYPDSFSLVHGVGQIGMHLAELVQGSWRQTKSFPRNNSMATLICQVLGGEGKQKLGKALRQLMTQALGQLPKGARLSVVEIGRELPSYAGDIQAVMDPQCCDLTFVGTAADFEPDGPPLKERYPRLQLIPLALQGEATKTPPVAHLVLLTLDFLTLEEAHTALCYARSCLAPGGSLVVVGLHPARWVDFLYGGQPGHWSFSEDAGRRSRQNGPQFWMQQLQQLQFANVSLLTFSADTLSGPYMLLAQPAEGILPPAGKSEQTGPRSWILLIDGQGPSTQLADQLAARLQIKGDMVVVAQVDEATDLAALFTETTALYGELDGILHLAGLAAMDRPSSAEVEVERQATRCTMAANILQACESSGTKTACWLVCSGTGELKTGAAHSEFPCSDGALWGFGQTLMNEALELHVRLVDLEQIDASASVDALVRELESSR